MVGLMNEVKACGGMVTTHATNGDMIDFLVAKHKSEGKLSPLYHYISQPEVTEVRSLWALCRYGRLYWRKCLYRSHLTCEGALNHIRDATKRNQKCMPKLVFNT
jgi:dihydropyrimidinase